MAYTIIQDFSAGLDHRKSALTAKPGSLRALNNAYITPGGEIQKRNTFTSAGVLPATYTHGLSFDGENLVVFGTHNPGDVPALPDYVTYQQLSIADTETIVRIADAQIFAGQTYVVAKFSDGSYRHFYNGTLVPNTQVQGTNVRSHKTKLYAVDGPNLRFSAILDPTDWTVGPGYGIIDVTTEDAGTVELVGMEEYYGQLAVFGRTSIQLWAMDPDPALSTLSQVLGGIGLVAPNAVARYGSGDVLFLSNTGIRSLRARDISNSAAINDVGSPVDALIAARRALLTAEDAETIVALTDPLTGHYWLVWGVDVFVLSAYPNSKVTAWSTFSLANPIDYITLANSRIAARVGDELLIYGQTPASGVNPFGPHAAIGDPAEAFDDTAVVVETPFFDVGRPATEKRWTGLDVTCTGVWDIAVDCGTDGGWQPIGRVTGSTWSLGRFPLDLSSTHIAFRFTSVGDGDATLSSIAVHHDRGDEA